MEPEITSEGEEDDKSSENDLDEEPIEKVLNKENDKLPTPPPTYRTIRRVIKPERETRSDS